MTYLELLERVKHGTQPKAIRSTDENIVYFWNGCEYQNEYDKADRIHDGISDSALVTFDIFEAVE